MDNVELKNHYTDKEFEDDFKEFSHYTSLNIKESGTLVPMYLIIIKRPDKITKYFVPNPYIDKDKYIALTRFGMDVRKSYITKEEPGELLGIFMSHEGWLSFDTANGKLPHEDPQSKDVHSIAGYTVDGRILFGAKILHKMGSRIVAQEEMDLSARGADKPLFDAFFAGYSYLDNIKELNNKLLHQKSGSKYFIRYQIISELNGKEVFLTFFINENQRKSRTNVRNMSSKVEAGQNLEEVLKKELTEMGIKEFTLVSAQDDGTAKDRHGKDIKRILLYIKASYVDVCANKFDGLYMDWLTKEQYLGAAKG